MPDLKEWFGTLDRVPAPDLWRKIERRRPAELSLDRSGRRVAVAALALAVAVAGVGVAVWAFVGRGGARPVATPFPIRPKINGEIAFVGGPRSAQPAIYVVRSDGGGLEKLTTGRVAFDPAWSPDGTRIAFAAGKPSNLYVMNSDGSGLNRISRCGQGCADTQPAWSPDGRQIAFVRSGDIYAMNADGSSVRKLTHAVTPLGDAQPAWSPDGTRIAFVVLRQPASNEPAVHVMNADGTNVRTASRCAGEGCAESGPSWSPDGRRMAFIRDGEILITSDNKFGLPTLVECSRIAGCVALGEPEWSPDGAQLLFTVERRNSSRQLFSMQLDTGKIKAVLPATIDLCCPSWQPLSSG